MKPLIQDDTKTVMMVKTMVNAVRVFISYPEWCSAPDVEHCIDFTANIRKVPPYPISQEKQAYERCGDALGVTQLVD